MFARIKRLWWAAGDRLRRGKAATGRWYRQMVWKFFRRGTGIEAGWALPGHSAYCHQQALKRIQERKPGNSRVGAVIAWDKKGISYEVPHAEWTDAERGQCDYFAVQFRYANSPYLPDQIGDATAYGVVPQGPAERTRLFPMSDPTKVAMIDTIHAAAGHKATAVQAEWDRIRASAEQAAREKIGTGVEVRNGEVLTMTDPEAFIKAAGDEAIARRKKQMEADQKLLDRFFGVKR